MKRTLELQDRFFGSWHNDKRFHGHQFLHLTDVMGRKLTLIALGEEKGIGGRWWGVSVSLH